MARWRGKQPAAPEDDYVRSPAHAIGDEPALRGVTGAELPDFAAIYRHRREQTSSRRRFGALAIAAAVSGPFAILGALLGPGGLVAGVVLIVAIGPAVEELLKAAGALHLVEQRPWLVPNWWSLVLIVVISGLVFAAIENAFYLWLFIDDPSPEVVRWRWIAGPLVHGVSSAVAGIGVGRMWLRLDRSERPAAMTTALPWLVAAVVLHGGYNATVTILELTGRIF